MPAGRTFLVGWRPHPLTADDLGTGAGLAAVTDNLNSTMQRHCENWSVTAPPRAI